MGGNSGKKKSRAGGDEPWKIPLNPVEDEGEDDAEAWNDGGHAPEEKKTKDGKKHGAMKKRSAEEGSGDVEGGIKKKKSKKKKRTSVGEAGLEAEAAGAGLSDGAGPAKPGAEAGSEKGREGGKRKAGALAAGAGGGDESSPQKKQKKKLKVKAGVSAVGQGQGAAASPGGKGEAVAEGGVAVTVHAFPTDDADHAETPRVRSP